MIAVACRISSTMPANYPLDLYRGDTRVWTDIFRDANDETIDLTGYTWLAQIRPSADDATVLAVFDVDTSDAVNGRIKLTLAASVSADLPTERAYWDLQATKPDGTVRTYLAGRVYVRGDVSRTP